MRIKNLAKMKNKKNQGNVPASWYKSETQPARKPDLIDDAVASMVRSIQAMNKRGVPFSIETYLLLIASWRRCANLNDSLMPTQRLVVLKLLKARTSTANLEEILRKASKQ